MWAKARWFWLAVALQVLILLGMIATHAFTLATGTAVRLKTAPVDPRDPFMGQYVLLRYEVSSLDPAKVAVSGTPYKRDQTLWVTLRRGDPFWTAVAVSDRRPGSLQSGDVVVKAFHEYTGPTWTGAVEPVPPPEGQKPAPPEQPIMPPDRINVGYGIEQFYVPEGEAPKLEEQREKLSVEAKVDTFGRAALSRVFAGEEEIRFQ